MRKVSLISVVAFLAMTGVFKGPTVSAQSKTCSLVLDISTLDENGNVRQIKNARAFVVRKNTRARIPATVVAGSPQFPRLRAGSYRLTILKRGFRTSTRNVDFSCGPMDSKIEFQVSLEPTAGFRESTTAGVPPVRRGVTTIIGSAGPEDGSVERKTETTLQPLPNSISGGVLNGKALELPKPIYPPIARQAHASGTVVVQVIIDETGNVIEARAVSGHPLLQSVCVGAARNAKFSPTKLAGQPVKVSGLITYNFIAE